MYILECCDGSYYTGSTNDLQRRIYEHQHLLGANYTRKRQPVILVYYEEYPRIDEAFYREKQVQGWSHAKKKALVKNNNKDLSLLSMAYRDRFYNGRFESLSDPKNHSDPENLSDHQSLGYPKNLSGHNNFNSQKKLIDSK